MDAFAFVHDSTDPHTAGNMAPESEHPGHAATRTHLLELKLHATRPAAAAAAHATHAAHVAVGHVTEEHREGVLTAEELREDLVGLRLREVGRHATRAVQAGLADLVVRRALLLAAQHLVRL